MIVRDKWNYAPYLPLDRMEQAKNPYLCRVIPNRNGAAIRFLDGIPGCDHTFLYRKQEEETWTEIPLQKELRCEIKNLEEQEEYACKICRTGDGVCSAERKFRTGDVPGTVVNYLHPEDTIYQFSGRFLCSPCLCRLPGGRLISSMDVYGPGYPQNLTLLFYSDDDGETWDYLTELFPCYWGTLFFRNGTLYMLSCTTEYGDLQIGASHDLGRSWSVPTVLFRGSGNKKERGIHKAPASITEANGRIWAAIEFGCWEQMEYSNAVLSAPADCTDYTDPAVWTLTPFWKPAEALETEEKVTAIEGNIVQSPEGTLYDFLRFRNGRCLLLQVDSARPEAPLTYAGTVKMEITTSKFEIHRDSRTGDYFALCSCNLKEQRCIRNVLGLFRSGDLKNWACQDQVLGAADLDPEKIGFQYVSFLIEGDDILFLSRTAYNQANSFHDTNYQTFHRIKNFRDRNPRNENHR